MGYLSLITIQFLGLLFIAGRFQARKYCRTWQYALIFLLGGVYSFEFLREIAIWIGGLAPDISPLRLVMLRLEQTLLGMFINEIYHYCRK